MFHLVSEETFIQRNPEDYISVYQHMPYCSRFEPRLHLR